MKAFIEFIEDDTPVVINFCEMDSFSFDKSIESTLHLHAYGHGNELYLSYKFKICTIKEGKEDLMIEILNNTLIDLIEELSNKKTLEICRFSDFKSRVEKYNSVNDIGLRWEY